MTHAEVRETLDTVRALCKVEPLTAGSHDLALQLAERYGYSIYDSTIMELFTNEIMSGLLASSLKTASIDANGWHDCGEGPGCTEGKYINWLTIKGQEESVLEDVKRIRNHPLVPTEIPIYGYIYDVKSGKLIEVPDATQAGKAT